MRGRRESGLRGNVFDGQPRIPQLAADVLKADSPQLLGDSFAKHVSEAYFQQAARHLQPLRHIGNADSFAGVKAYYLAGGCYDAAAAFYILGRCPFYDGPHSIHHSYRIDACGGLHGQTYDLKIKPPMLCVSVTLCETPLPACGWRVRGGSETVVKRHLRAVGVPVSSAGARKWVNSRSSSLEADGGMWYHVGVFWKG